MYQLRMNTLAEIYAKYQGPDCHTGSDKGTIHGYIPVYERLLAPHRDTPLPVVEIGIMTGHSLRMWEEFFHRSKVHGIDLNDHPHDIADLRPMIAEGTHNIHLFDATNRELTDAAFGKTLFEVIIDDASHSLEQQLLIYRNFKDRLAPGGIYIIEDVENLDRDRAVLENITHTRKVEILDLRPVKQRFDDVLVVITDR